MLPIAERGIMSKVKIAMGRVFPLKNGELSGTFSVEPGKWTEDDHIELVRLNGKEVEVSLPIQDGDGSVLLTAALGSEIRDQLQRLIDFTDREFPNLPEPSADYFEPELPDASEECEACRGQGDCPMCCMTEYSPGNGQCDSCPYEETCRLQTEARDSNEQTNNDNQD
jgi:hypothetical protein